MRRDEPFPIVFDERQQVGLLLLVELDLAVAEEEDRVDVGQARAAAGRLAGRPQRVLRDDVRVGADVAVVGARLVAEPLDHRHRVRHRVVLRDAVPGVGPDQQRLARLRAAGAAASLPAAAAALPRRWRAGYSRGRLRGRLGEHPQTAQHHGDRGRGEPGAKHQCPFGVQGSGFRVQQVYCSVKAISVSAVGLWRNPPPPAAIATYCLPSRPM